MVNLPVAFGEIIMVGPSCSQLSSTSPKFSWNKCTCSFSALCENAKNITVHLIPPINIMSCAHLDRLKRTSDEKLNVCWA